MIFIAEWSIASVFPLVECYDDTNVIEIFIHIHVHKGVARRGRGEAPLPETEKNCCREMVLFRKALFLVTNFQKIKNKKINKFKFSIEVSLKNFRIFSKFSNNSRSSSKLSKINAEFVNLFEKYAKIMRF